MINLYKNLFKTLLFIILLSQPTFADNKTSSPKREFRGVWIATAFNIDWPSAPGLSVSTQKNEAINMLNRLKADGINAVIFQVRPEADAFYQSKYCPWSRYLTGTQGRYPGYDPLAFWIKECHKRNMELHAWLNPLRIAMHTNDKLASTHIALRHHDWVIEYGNKLYFDPGIPQVRAYLAGVVQELTTNYDIDAIHFDDYFYPYPTGNTPFPDQKTFREYSGGLSYNKIYDWRRNNINQLIQQISQTIKSTKPWVKFGISPFGVWRNQSSDPEGSKTRAGITNYDDLYADILLWAQQDWINYIIPQVYWCIGNPAADFKTLIQWWSDHKYNCNLYIGQSLYKATPSSTKSEWRCPQEIPNQIMLMRETPGISGSAFYSAKWIKKNLMGIENYLQTSLYNKPSIIPITKSIDKTPPDKPFRIREKRNIISWKTLYTENEMDKPCRYVIYKSNKRKMRNSDDPSSILVITSSTSIKIEKGKGKTKKHFVRISALDRTNNESKLSRAVKIKW
ncbi:MAG: family 10 glycosylhydrolase [Parabacteroides sp.]